MASAMDLALVFLDGCDKKELRCASREFAHDGRSPAERLLAMTRRANDVRSQLDWMTNRRDYIQASLEYVRDQHDHAIVSLSRSRMMAQTLNNLVRPEDRWHAFGRDY